MFLFFFFQAEDGIRDWSVTGVQTCALPIYSLLLVPGNKESWPDVRNRLNRLLRGWSNYFSYGTRLMAYRAIDNHVNDRVRHFLRRRCKVPGRGTRSFADHQVFGPLGGLRLRRVDLGPLPCARQ